MTNSRRLPPIIDAHHHLWELNGRVFNPGLHDRRLLPDGDHERMVRDFLPADYREVAADENVLATVYVEAEADRAAQVDETRWVHEQAAANGLPNAMVAHAWFDTPNAEEVIAAQAEFPLVRGIRSKPLTAAGPDHSVRGEARSLQDERWLSGLGLLERYQLSYDLRIPWWHLAEAAEIPLRYPGLPIALNHAGCPWDRSPEGLGRWRHGMEKLAAFPNVCCKISFLLVPGEPWDEASNLEVVRDTIRIFGADRCMFASNFPVDAIKIDYHSLYAFFRAATAPMDEAARDGLFWANAANFYRIELA